MSTPDPGPMENLVDALDEQSDLLSVEELREDLCARGIDVDGFLGRMLALQTSHQKAARTSWMKVAEQKSAVLSASRNALRGWLDRGEEEIRAAFAALSTGPQVIAFRNKSDDLPLAEMARILEDCDQLKARQASTAPLPPE